MSYSEKDLQIVIEDIEKIKKRPDMYIGETKWSAAMHLAKEILQNSIDEAMVKDSKCKLIKFSFNEITKEFVIEDDGRGIPLGVIVESCTIIQASGKFTKGGQRAYGYAAGELIA